MQKGRHDRGAARGNERIAEDDAIDARSAMLVVCDEAGHLEDVADRV
jgi:hypothetical protein